MTTQVCPERTRAIHRCPWTITRTAQGCIIIHPRYVWKGPGLYIDVPGPPHVQGCIIKHPRYVWKGPGLYIDVPGPSHIQPRAVLYYIPGMSGKDQGYT